MARSRTQTAPASILDGTAIPKLDAYIIDVDGTVALRGNRDAFQFELAKFDLPNRPVVSVINMLAEYSHARMIFITGREEQYRVVTAEWLEAHILTIDMLLMRRTGDNRPDWLVKQELYENTVFSTFNVLGVFDDRQQVVDMWRRMGLTCFQVAPGNF